VVALRPLVAGRRSLRDREASLQGTLATEVFGRSRSLASGRAQQPLPADAHECALRNPFRDASRSRRRERLREWSRTDPMASSVVAVVIATTYVTPACRCDGEPLCRSGAVLRSVALPVATRAPPPVAGATTKSEAPHQSRRDSHASQSATRSATEKTRLLFNCPCPSLSKTDVPSARRRQSRHLPLVEYNNHLAAKPPIKTGLGKPAHRWGEVSTIRRQCSRVPRCERQPMLLSQRYDDR
jgi:hypothetical protein